MSNWTRTCALSDLEVHKGRVVKVDGKQVAIFRLPGDAIYAVDNRCPHEGYPLGQGYVQGCVLTCAWHNFKFDLRDGSCLLGDEGVRTFPVRVVDGEIELDLRDPDPAASITARYQSLETALLEDRMGQAIRDTTRLLQHGEAPEAIALWTARFDAERAEFGCTHAVAVAADVLDYLDRYEGTDAIWPLAQVLDQASRGNIRRPRRPLAEPRDPGPDPVAAGRRLRALVEREEASDAEALLRGALARGWGRRELEPWFYGLCADHFLNFGHPFLYTAKIFDLMDRAGTEHADVLLSAHLYGCVTGTRHDTLPKWKRFTARLEKERERVDASYHARGDEPSIEAGQALRQILLDGSSDDWFDGALTALEDGASLSTLVHGILVGGAGRMMRFDTSIHQDPGVQDDWLDVTHTLTVATALLDATARFDDPDVLRIVLHAGYFVIRAQPLDLTPESRPDVSALTPTEDMETMTAAILDAIGRGDAMEATRMVRGAVETGLPLDPLRHALMDLPLKDVVTRPIVVSHVLKTTLAAFRATASLAGDPERAWPLMGLVGFLARSGTERRVARRVHEALRFVVDGKTPRTLAG